jgi:hypothetical protein
MELVAKVEPDQHLLLRVLDPRGGVLRGEENGRKADLREIGIDLRLLRLGLFRLFRGGAPVR